MIITHWRLILGGGGRAESNILHCILQLSQLTEVSSFQLYHADIKLVSATYQRWRESHKNSENNISTAFIDS